ncbi:IS66 family insertion sequence element accessory protein TnpB [Lactiplantibacillus pentosus]|uniref:IS66 family insertion sequence element accessory protein TnpB n=1 Tax=Lactiplantibacillus pentosus TaxID=1589 RepID=UPI001C20029D|nr:IS66 family insertion sequence element accessory protein TnpB [Lactiplantibacillus pentosus]MBU7502658.1 IS66 family insertion sequence element accessory protein TnpB [Lactiplantibacillus pentosus]MDY1545775.1 IS66 family insertion sequence element accessory protein TnpB [Lactiplantibacillus pentosus]
MIIDTSKIEQVYLVCGKTDLRKGIDGLAGIVQEQYDLDPYSQALYLFCGTRKDRFKALYWDLLLYKRLENGHLQWPTNQLAIRRLDPRQLVRLLSGWALDSTVHKVCPPGH